MHKFMHESNRLWDYEIVRELGRGEYGQVYQVRLKRDGKMYALKKINIQGMHEKQKLQAFRQIKALKLLSHPNIIEYHDSFLSLDNIYIVTQYAEKGDLSTEIANRLRREKKFTQQQLWDLFEGLVQAMKHLHESNIVHRDIKVENIFQVSPGKYKIGDLGMSKLLYDSEMISTRVGTPIYFAPEIIQHKLYSFPVDVWALGCVFYYLAALEHPFKDATIETLGYYVVERDPKPIKGAYSPQLITFINQILDKNPQTRPTIADLFRKLKQRKQLKITNKVSIFNLRQILALKSQHIGQVNRQLNQSRQIGLISPKKIRAARLNQSLNRSQVVAEEGVVGQTNPEKHIDRRALNGNNLSMFLPKFSKSTNKSQQKNYQECSSPLIKTNGFNTQRSSPERTKPSVRSAREAHTQLLRYSTPKTQNPIYLSDKFQLPSYPNSPSKNRSFRLP